MREDVHAWSEAITIGDLLLRGSQRTPTIDAAVGRTQRLTYRELADRAQLLGRGLIALGVRPGDRVGVLMPNSPANVAALYAVALAGAVVVPMNIRYRSVELPFVIRDSGLRTILTTGSMDEYVDLLGLLEGALPGLAEATDPQRLDLPQAPELRSVVLFDSDGRPGVLTEGDLTSLAQAVSREHLEHRRASVRVRDEALLLYTSGTTSTPRGCRITHEAVVRNWTIVGQILDLGEGDRMWAPAPTFHVGGFGPVLACASVGATVLLDTYFDAGRALSLLEAERATHLYAAFPPITQPLLDHPSARSVDLTSVRVVLNIAPVESLRRMKELIPNVSQVSLYGSTEGSGAITYTSLGDDLEITGTTCGLPLPGIEVRIVDPQTRQDVPVGAEGEIAFRGFGLFEGYLNHAEKTATVFDAEGWYHTGDKGAVDACGRLRFLGRFKDMLRVGGENVAPLEIEEVLAEHPAVKLVQVVGVPDSRLDEVPGAFVELRAAMTATEEELIDYCRPRIARFKVPRHVRFVAEWPMSASKIQKGPLREQLIRELENGSDRS
jgi:fatty-acyl-CoA synthase